MELALKPDAGVPYLPQLCHRLAGDDLIAVKPCDEAERLELALAPLQLP